MEHHEDTLNMAFLEEAHGTLRDFLERFRHDYIVDQADPDYPDSCEQEITPDNFCQLYTETDVDMSGWEYVDSPLDVGNVSTADTEETPDVIFIKTVITLN